MSPSRHTHGPTQLASPRPRTARGMYARGRLLAAAFGLGLIAAACSPAPETLPQIDRSLTFEDIDSQIYFPETNAPDPFEEVYQGFRDRRAEHMADPEMPPPIEPYQTVHRSRDLSWTPIEEAFRFNWTRLEALEPGASQQLAQVLRVKRAFDHPDLKIDQVMLGPGGVLPTHAEGAPGVYIVIEGTGVVTVGSEAFEVTPGTNVKLEPYSGRRIAAADSAVLKLLWIRWAPGGDHRYIKAGYYLTGSNQHVQPKQATLPETFEFWGEQHLITPVEAPATSETTGEFFTSQAADWARARSELGTEGTSLYPDVPVFSHESAAPWLDLEAVQKSNLMWAKDVLSTGAMLERWTEVVRMEGIFQARRADNTWDFNISQQAWGSGSRYVEHSHSIPEFYYMLSGNVEHWNDGQKFDAQPGDVFMTNSFQTHQSRVKPEGEIWRSFGSTWVPGGDRTVFERPYFLLEAPPQQVESAILAPDAKFH